MQVSPGRPQCRYLSDHPSVRCRISTMLGHLHQHHLCCAVSQELALPVLLDGANAVVAAETGSGKTICYLVPVISQLLNHSQGEAHSSLPSQQRYAFKESVMPSDTCIPFALFCYKPSHLCCSLTSRPGHHQHVPCSGYAALLTQQAFDIMPQVTCFVIMTAHADVQGGQYHPRSPGALPQRSPLPSGQVGR